MIETAINHMIIPEHMILKDKYFFLHIPKTAGTSLKFLLMEQFPKDDIFPAQTSDHMEDIDEEVIPKYKLYIGHHRYQFVDYFAPFRPQLITMLRDPIQRVLSDYYFARSRPDVDLYISECPTIDDYLAHPNIQNRIFNNQTQHLLGVRYGDLIDLDPEDCFDVMVQRLDDMEFVGITEHFAESLALLAHTFGWRMSDEIRRNVSHHQRDDKEITRLHIDKIRQKNELDYRVYRYAKQLFQKRLNHMSQTAIQVNNHQRYLAQLTFQDSVTIDFAKDVWLGDGWGIRMAGGRNLPVNTDIRFHVALNRTGDLSLRLFVMQSNPEDLLQRLIVHVNGDNISLDITKKSNRGWDVMGILPIQTIRNSEPSEFYVRINHDHQPDDAEEETGITLRRLVIKPINHSYPKQSDAQALADLRATFEAFQQLKVLNDTYYFLHIQKTAGTSLKTLLASKFHKQDVFPAHRDQELADFPVEQIPNYKMYIGHHKWDFIEHFHPNRPQLITLLRHPVTRIVSQYYFNRNSIKNYPRIADCPTLLDYVNYPYFQARVNNFQSRLIMGDDYDKLTQLNLSDQIDIVTQRLGAFEFVGVTERFVDAMVLLDTIFGWMPSEEIRRNISHNRPKVNDHDDAVLETIRLKNQLDIAVYQYAKELFEERFRQMSQPIIASHNHRRYLAQQHAYHDEIKLHFGEDIVYGTGWIVNAPRGRELPANTDAHIYLPLASTNDFALQLFVVAPKSATVIDALQMRISEHPIRLTLTDNTGAIWAIEGQIPKPIIADNQLTCITLRLDIGDEFSPNLSLRRLSIIAIAPSEDSTLAIVSPVEQLEQELGASIERASQLEDVLQSQSADLDRLQIIETSWSWNLILRLNRLRLKVIPRDSRRERWYIAVRDRIVGQR